jgi:hypothetical protein
LFELIGCFVVAEYKSSDPGGRKRERWMTARGAEHRGTGEIFRVQRSSALDFDRVFQKRHPCGQIFPHKSLISVSSLGETLAV